MFNFLVVILSFVLWQNVECFGSKKDEVLSDPKPKSGKRKPSDKKKPGLKLVSSAADSLGKVIDLPCLNSADYSQKVSNAIELFAQALFRNSGSDIYDNAFNVVPVVKEGSRDNPFSSSKEGSHRSYELRMSEDAKKLILSDRVLLWEAERQDPGITDFISSLKIA